MVKPWAEEIYKPFIVQPLLRRLFAHPQEDRFDRPGFDAGLRSVGFTLVVSITSRLGHRSYGAAQGSRENPDGGPAV